MIKRRKFMALAGAAGLAPWAGLSLAQGEKPVTRDYYLLQQYQVESAEQKGRLDAYLQKAAIPALNRLGIKPVGVFYPQEGISPVYVLLRHSGLDVLLGLVDRLLSDAAFAREGVEVVDAVTPNPGYKRMEAALMVAFEGMKQMETPAKGPDRVFQLRIYESPSLRTGRKKIEMFNQAGEIEIFRRVGLNPVFFGETLVGPKMPNLTYMLGFDNEDALKAAWTKFRTDPGWLKLRAMPEYADKTILCGITNLVLRPAPYSQI